MTKKIILPLIILIGVFVSCKNDTEKKKEPQKVSTEEVKKKETTVKSPDYLKKGKMIAQSTGKTLKGKLKAAVQKGGLKNGINVCNGVAQKLMDSMSVVHNAKIKRTSTKLRNLDDAPNQEELAVLSQYHKELAKGNKIKPIVRKAQDGIHFYAPIFIEDVCLNCHGVIGQKLKPETYKEIKKYYPKDEAINYKKGDLRAIWSIVMKK